MDKLPVGDALGTLLLYISGPGVIALLLYWVGTKRPRESSQMNLAALYTDKLALERTANSLTELARAFDGNTDAIRDNTDAMRELSRSWDSRPRR